MKKTVFTSIVLLLTIAGVFYSCKKDNHNTTPNTTTTTGGIPINTTPAYMPPQPGFLKTNISTLVLHAGDNASISASLYNANGTLATAQPALIWQSKNTSIASISNGNVTAVDTGVTTISVTDGVHGFVNINISVVNINKTIASGVAAQIDFNVWPGILGLRQNMTRGFDYTVYDLKGNVVNVTPNFVVPTGSPLTITSNSVTSSTINGTWKIRGVVNNDTLNGFLNAVVFNSSDTNVTFGPAPFSFPSGFNYYNVSSNIVPIVVTKCWWDPINGFGLYVYTTSPTSITIDAPSVAKLNSAGYITSVGPGLTNVKMTYDGVTFTSSIVVFIDYTGNWGGQSNGKVYNVCFDKEAPDIHYTCGGVFLQNYSTDGDFDLLPPYYEKGTSYVTLNGVTLTSATNNIASVGATYIPEQMDAPIYPTSFISALYIPVNAMASSSPPLFYWDNDNSKLKLVDGTYTVTLTNGSGNCSGTTTVTPSDSAFASWYFNGVLYQGADSNNVINISADTSSNECGVHYKSLTLFSNFNMNIAVKLGAQITGIGSYTLIDSLVCTTSSGTGTNTVTSFPTFFSDNTGDYNCKSGTLNITEYNANYVGGTFSFTGVSYTGATFNITQGKFKARRLY